MKIKKFNESSSYDLSFDGFKDIMSDITDDLKCDYDFSDYDEKTDPNLSSYKASELSHWYECLIRLRESEFPISDNMPELNYNFLEEREGGLPFTEDPETFTQQNIRTWIGKIEDENNNILSLKSKIDNQVEKNTEVRLILIKLAKLQTRFKSFDNFKECRIGFENNGNLSIYFEVK